MSDEKEPLRDEAAAREKWRGSDEPPKIETGHSLPASEDQDERLGAGETGAAPAAPRTPLPPD